jgi:hypothetical protein
MSAPAFATQFRAYWVDDAYDEKFDFEGRSHLAGPAHQTSLRDGWLRGRADLAIGCGSASSEEWVIDEDGLIAESKGHFDQAEDECQLEPGVDLGGFGIVDPPSGAQ